MEHIWSILIVAGIVLVLLLANSYLGIDGYLSGVSSSVGL